jgi:hypothetical protein
MILKANPNPITLRIMIVTVFKIGSFLIVSHMLAISPLY